jgi:hypothetical protein
MMYLSKLIASLARPSANITGPQYVECGIGR